MKITMLESYSMGQRIQLHRGGSYNLDTGTAREVLKRQDTHGEPVAKEYDGYSTMSEEDPLFKDLHKVIRRQCFDGNFNENYYIDHLKKIISEAKKDAAESN